MKTLQNNYTSPEQSEKLLELGLPADSADMYYSRTSTTHFWDPSVIVNGTTFTMISKLYRNFILLPCWSVGRLIEIYLTCALEYHPYDDFYTETPSLHLMAFDKDRLIEEVIEIMSEDEMDFLKLEE